MNTLGLPAAGASADAPPKAHTLTGTAGSPELDFAGGSVDISGFIAAHSSDRTPTSRCGATVRTRADKLLDRIWEAGGFRIQDGRQVVEVERDGQRVLVPVEELSVVEGAVFLYGRRR